MNIQLLTSLWVDRIGLGRVESCQ